MNKQIIEIFGAFIGDGWIQNDEKALYITGDRTEDKRYYDEFIAPLFSKHFIEIKPKEFPYWKVYGIGCYKKDVINKALKLGFQKGKKCYLAKIPEKIMNSNNLEITKSILRGIFDTDGSFWCEKSNAKTSCEWKRTHNYHPEFGISSCSKKLVDQIHILLKKLNIESKVAHKNKKGFKNNRNNNDSYALRIRKKSEIERWFNIIGTNNPRHQTRYAVWEKLGHLPPRTTIKERIIILKNYHKHLYSSFSK